jgi:hypothetical protein
VCTIFHLNGTARAIRLQRYIRFHSKTAAPKGNHDDDIFNDCGCQSRLDDLLFAFSALTHDHSASCEVTERLDRR